MSLRYFSALIILSSIIFVHSAYGQAEPTPQVDPRADTQGKEASATLLASAQDEQDPPKSSLTEAIERGVNASNAVVPQGVVNSNSPLTDRSSYDFTLQSDFVTIRLGMLLSAMADFGFKKPQSDLNGFQMTDARLAFFGELGKTWRYLFQSDFARNNASILDFRITFQPHALARIQFGLFKVPFSAEFLLPAADTDLNNRAQIVRALAPKRSVGLEVGGAFDEQVFFYRVGVFNGTPGLENDGNNFLFAGRVGTDLSWRDDWAKFALAADIAWSEDTAAKLSLLAEPFAGTRLLVGADTRLTLGIFHLASELIYGQLSPTGAQSFDVYGYHVTSGLAVLPYLQFLIRWDSMYREDTQTQSDLLIPSVSFVVPDFPPLQAQLDVEIPVNAADQTHAFLSMTVAF